MTSPSRRDDPLDYVDFADVIEHGDPSKWMYLGPKTGSPSAATSPRGTAGTTKHYDLYRDVHGDEVELHYFRYPDGSVSDVKVK